MWQIIGSVIQVLGGVVALACLSILAYAGMDYLFEVNYSLWVIGLVCIFSLTVFNIGTIIRKVSK